MNFPTRNSIRDNTFDCGPILSLSVWWGTKTVCHIRGQLLCQGALCRLGDEVLRRRELIYFLFFSNKLNKRTLFVFMTFKTELTLKDRTNLILLLLFIFGGPRHLSSFKHIHQKSSEVFWERLFFPLRTACLSCHGKINISESSLYYSLINIVNIKKESCSWDCISTTNWDSAHLRKRMLHTSVK